MAKTKKEKSDARSKAGKRAWAKLSAEEKARRIAKLRRCNPNKSRSKPRGSGGSKKHKPKKTQRSSRRRSSRGFVFG